MADTLVLDVNGFPIATMNWQDVMTLYAKNRITVIEGDPKRPLRSESMILDLPVVVQLRTDFNRKQRREIQFSKRNVAKRDDFRCQYCGIHLDKKDYTYDHILPLSRGGRSSWKNLVLCCRPCNMFKANRTPEEAHMWLIKDPIRPDVHDKRFRYVLRIKKMKPQWKAYSKFLKEN